MSTADSSIRAARLALRHRQARVARAVLLAERGENAAALALANAVLREDPDFAAARALVDRLSTTVAPPESLTSNAHQPAVSEPAPRTKPPLQSPASVATAPPASTAAPVPLPSARASAAAPVRRRPDRASWAQFEQRMRLRRETTCATAMRQAMDAGDYETALARARELAQIDPAWNEIRLLLEQGAGPSAPAPPAGAAPVLPVPIAAPTLQLAGDDAAVRSRSVNTSHAGTPALVFVLLLAIAAVFGWSMVKVFRPEVAPETQPRPSPVTAPAAEVEVPNLPPIGTANPTPEAPRASPDRATATTPTPATLTAPAGATTSAKEKTIANDRPTDTNQRPTERPSPASSAQAPVPSAANPAPGLGEQRLSAPSTLSPSRPPTSRPFEQQWQPQSPAPPTPPPAVVGSSGKITMPTTTAANNVEAGTGALQNLPLTTVQPEAPPSAPMGSAASPLSTSSDVRQPSSTPTDAANSSPTASGAGAAAAAANGTSTLRSATPATSSAAIEANEHRAVWGALAAYQQGYSALDASAVKRVWPQVDAHSLQSAFGQLESQRVAFSGCSIDVHGLRATATCRGTASYVPKVGSGDMVTMEHTWRFDLRKFGESWLIDAATTK